MLWMTRIIVTISDVGNTFKFKAILMKDNYIQRSTEITNVPNFCFLINCLKIATAEILTLTLKQIFHNQTKS